MSDKGKEPPVSGGKIRANDRGTVRRETAVSGADLTREPIRPVPRADEYIAEEARHFPPDEQTKLQQEIFQGGIDEGIRRERRRARNETMVDSPRSDPIARTEIAAQLEGAQAKADVRLEKSLGEIRAEFAGINAKLASLSGIKTTVIITGVSVFFGILASAIGVMGYGAQWFGNGLTQSQIISAAASAGAANAIEQYTKQSEAAAKAP